MAEAGRPPTWGQWTAFWAYRAFAFLLAVIHRRTALALGDAVGRLAFRLDGRRRRIALDNLALAFSQTTTAAERRTIARKSFRNFGRVVFDTLALSRRPREYALGLVDVEGQGHLEAALAPGRGVLVFTAHYGNWEIGCGPISGTAPFGVIARPLDNPLIDRSLVLARERLGVRVIPKTGAGRHILRALGRNEIIGLLIDQNVLRREAVFVDFFGRLAGTTPALAAFHLKTGAPLLPLFIDPLPAGRYRLRLLEPLVFPPTGPAREDVLKITGICTKMIEREIRDRPEAWLWFHKRWQSRPVDER
ncbi:MAG: hypothetical protein FJY82_15390 [Candidatus Aminicenantes bacterium]|nr:hypothetical protein [Candidatus Aminicenantes bacterium]